MIPLKPMVCKNCALYEKFKEKCWFYWERKRKCTQFVDKDSGRAKYRDLDEDFEKIINKDY